MHLANEKQQRRLSEFTTMAFKLNIYSSTVYDPAAKSFLLILPKFFKNSKYSEGWRMVNGRLCKKTRLVLVRLQAQDILTSAIARPRLQSVLNASLGYRSAKTVSDVIY